MKICFVNFEVGAREHIDLSMLPGVLLRLAKLFRDLSSGSDRSLDMNRFSRTRSNWTATELPIHVHEHASNVGVADAGAEDIVI